MDYDFPLTQETYAPESHSFYSVNSEMELDKGWRDYTYYDPKTPAPIHLRPVFEWNSDNQHLRAYFEEIKQALKESVMYHGAFFSHPHGPLVSYRMICQTQDLIHVFMNEDKTLTFHFNGKFYCYTSEMSTIRKVMSELTACDGVPAPYYALMKYEGDVLDEVAKFCDYMDKDLSSVLSKKDLILVQHLTDFHATYLVCKQVDDWISPQVKLHLCMYSRKIHFICDEGKCSLPFSDDSIKEVIRHILTTP